MKDLKDKIIGKDNYEFISDYVANELNLAHEEPWFDGIVGDIVKCIWSTGKHDVATIDKITDTINKLAKLYPITPLTLKASEFEDGYYPAPNKRLNTIFRMDDGSIRNADAFKICADIIVNNSNSLDTTITKDNKWNKFNAYGFYTINNRESSNKYTDELYDLNNDTLTGKFYCRFRLNTDDPSVFTPKGYVIPKCIDLKAIQVNFNGEYKLSLVGEVFSNIFNLFLYYDCVSIDIPNLAGKHIMALTEKDIVEANETIKKYFEKWQTLDGII